MQTALTVSAESARALTWDGPRVASCASSLRCSMGRLDMEPKVMTFGCTRNGSVPVGPAGGRSGKGDLTTPCASINPGRT
jgi:hypothetical protein